MPTMNTKDFNTLVSDQIASAQGRNAALVDTNVGSILRSIFEGCAAIVLWLQGLIVQLLAATRASTSTGSDLDTWMADFGVTRIAAIAASGVVTFSRFTTVAQVVLPFGARVQSTDGTQTYTVITDPTNSAYNLGLGGYVLGIGTATVNVTVTAVTPGSAGNVLANQITVITSAIPGIDTVTNALAFTNGANAESDSALRARFVVYLNSLSKATIAAIGYAINSLQINASYSIVENQQYGGATQYGYFYVVVDDGTGSPSGGFLATVGNAVNAVRPITVQFGIFAPVVVTANIAMVITTATGYTHSVVVAQVQAAIAAYVNSLTLGNSLPYTILAKIAYDTSPGVTNVTSITINSGTSDLTATAKQVIKIGTNVVS